MNPRADYYPHVAAQAPGFFRRAGAITSARGLMHFRSASLPNGLRIVSTPTPRMGSVAIGVWINVGGRHESAPLSGASHFIEHLLFKGTRRRSARMIAQLIEGRGGYLNAFTQEESTCFYARVMEIRAWEALDVLADMYLAPRFAPADIKRERDVVIEEIRMYQDQPQNVVEEMLGELVWPGHPLGRALVGTPETVRAMKVEAIKDFKAANYVPARTVIAVAGMADHARLVERVARYWGRCSTREPGAPEAVMPRNDHTRFAVRAQKVEQVHLAAGIRLFGRHDRRRYALKLLSVILGENMSSRLFQEVREKRGLAYAINSAAHLFEDTGMLAITAGLDRRQVVEAMEIIMSEVARMKRTVVSRRELQQAQEYAVGQLLLGLESASSQMQWLGETIVAYARWISPSEVIRHIMAITPEEIRRVADDVLIERNTCLAIVAPKLPRGSESALERTLEIG